MAAWILASVNRDSESRAEPFSFEEVVGWLGHGFMRTEPPAAPVQPTPDDLLERATMLHTLYDGSTVNGTGEE